MVVVVDNIEGCTFLDVDIGMYEINLWADIAVLTYGCPFVNSFRELHPE